MRSRALVAAAVVALAGLGLAGCDRDGDGLDDTTGQPVATPQPPQGGGCGPGGMPLLCGGGTGEDTPDGPETDTSDSGACGPGGWALLCGDTPESAPDPEMDPEWMAKVARHEAGHVAAAREFGASFTARVYPDGSG